MSIIGLPPQGDEDWYDYATSLDTEARTIAAKETPAGAQAKADAALAAANAAAPGLAPVQSVNGQTGVVVIATGGEADITTHEAAADPHAGYLLEATASATYQTQAVLPVGTTTGQIPVWDGDSYEPTLPTPVEVTPVAFTTDPDFDPATYEDGTLVVVYTA